MRIPEKTWRRRCGVTAVETSLVMLPLMLTMFSIFEYGRFVLVRQLLNLSTEVACRYALANNTTTVSSPGPGPPPLGHDVLTDCGILVNQYMGGFNTTTHFSSVLTTNVYAVPASTWNQTLTTTTASTWSGSTITNGGTWTVVTPTNATLLASPNTLSAVNGIQPGSPIAVGASGNFKMMFPTLLYVSPTIPMSSLVILTCEGT